jgi:PleD family two-component response regulator
MRFALRSPRVASRREVETNGGGRFINGNCLKDAKDNSLLLADQLSILADLEILVVDDDADMREFLPFMLEQYGATVTVVASAIEALTALSQSQPNLITSDIGMPEMDDYMLMRQVMTLAKQAIKLWIISSKCCF